MYNTTAITHHIKKSWEKIAPFWPLKNLIAVNPLQGLEDMPIEKALIEGAAFFEQKGFPEPLESINRETIKWLQGFFDEDQATLKMPLKKEGLYRAMKKLMYFDDRIHGNDSLKKAWILQLSDCPETAIAQSLSKLAIPIEEELLFITLSLTTLPGWASYIKYYADWSEEQSLPQYKTLKADYIAVRLIIISLLWKDATELITWHKKGLELGSNKMDLLKSIKKNETDYLVPLLNTLASQHINESPTFKAQFVFCIDIRSEPFRRALEKQDTYQTFGCAGSFGIPVCIKNTTTQQSYASCPVLIKPDYTVNESPYPRQLQDKDKKGYQTLNGLKGLYQSLKYNVTTSFALVELLGIFSGLWMTLRTFTPFFASTVLNSITKKIRPDVPFTPLLENISFTDQCKYAESALKGMGLIKEFAPLVIVCGHGSATQNNAYATALNCGACAGHHGGSNAKILTQLLNRQEIRDYLQQIKITIPQSTHFIAAEHTTTTDQVALYLTEHENSTLEKELEKIKNDLEQAKKVNNQQRCKNMGCIVDKDKSAQETKIRSLDWAQVRPEWGLAQNASFIVAPRALTKNIDLQGRSFLHSYNYFQDKDGSLLTAILTAPMIVGQWINSQYLFSTVDNVAYGSGSKITKNITGKIGIMQGNASDLMTGLPLQSVYKTDTQPYHTPVRLMVIVYAPTSFIDTIIQKEPLLRKLFSNGWVILTSIDPEKSNHYSFLNRNLTWGEKAHG